MTRLMIVESPKKVKLIGPMLGDGWTVAASVGHIRDLPQNSLGITLPNFDLEYVLTEKGTDVSARLKNMVKNASEIYLATDPDREGESISWHLKEVLGLVNPKRVTFNEITATAVRKAVQSPRSIDMNLVHAQDGRRALDRLVGYQVSPVLSRIKNAKLSAGRVQSPALRLVVEREREIRAFKSTKHYSAVLFFFDEKTKQTWQAHWVLKPLFVTDDNPYLLDRKLAEEISKTSAVIVKSYTDSERRRAPPAPFNTATLQQAASIALGLSPSVTMDLAQKLYTSGLITYHRTDNPNISEESFADIAKVAEHLKLDMAPSIRTFKIPDGAQAGHAAITPTEWMKESAGEDALQQSLYKLIRIRAIACQLADAKYAVRKAGLVSLKQVNSKAIEFEAVGQTLIYKGWLELLQDDQTEEKKTGIPNNPIPLLKRGESLVPLRGDVVEKNTRAPARYTEASLVQKLDAEGIGRPSTFAAILENIKTRNYITFDEAGKFVLPTDAAETIVDALVSRFDFIDIDYTKKLEIDLDQISQGRATYKSVIADAYQKLQSEIGALQSLVQSSANTHPCPKCGKPMNRIPYKNKFFWGCTDRETCKHTMNDLDGKPVPKGTVSETAQVADADFACKVCGKKLVHRVKTGDKPYDFWGCSGFSTGCKTTYKNKDNAPDFG